MQQEQRQIQPNEPAPVVKNTATTRVTRTRSDLPKEAPKPQSQEEEEEQDEEQSESQPKTKKIHHMTLKAIQRKQKLAQMEKAGLIPPQQPVQKPPPKKRGRPKGVKKIQQREDYDANFNEQSLQSPVPISQKKQITLRKRQCTKKLIQPESQEAVDNKQEELNNVEVEIQIPWKKVGTPPPVTNITPTQEAVIVPPTAPGPKKRGRKKKVQPENSTTTAPTSGPAVKVFTIPKAQTYDNYNKFYKKIVQQTKQREQIEAPLIFDKFSDPEGYKALLNSLKS